MQRVRTGGTSALPKETKSDADEPKRPEAIEVSPRARSDTGKVLSFVPGPDLHPDQRHPIVCLDLTCIPTNAILLCAWT